MKLERPEVCAIVGDLMHNLRCALDYIVTALVNASGTKLARKHQFPIFTDENRFREEVLSSDLRPNPRGCLRGITIGLKLID